MNGLILCLATVSVLPIATDSFTLSSHHTPTFQNKLTLVPLYLSSSPSNIEGPSTSKDGLPTSPLSMDVGKLGSKLNGQGRAIIAWDCYKIGLDPLYFFLNDDDNHGDGSAVDDVWDKNVVELMKHTSFNFHQSDEMANSEICQINPFFTDRNRIIEKYMPMKRRDIHSKTEGKGLGHKTLNHLSLLYPNALGLEYSIASLADVKRSSDGTVKLLLKLHNKHENSENQKGTEVKSNTHYYIESVIIPWFDRSNPTSTLCISSQVGCAQGCTFCATGKMGLMKQLTTDEILIQLYYAKKVCRILNKDRFEYRADVEDVDKVKHTMWLPDIDNIVFMGMGDSGGNANAVIEACSIMADRRCFAIPQNKITISTVAPSPETFMTLSKADAVLAWSVHAVNDELRKRLVPTTKYTMHDLREGLIEALIKRSKRGRSVMFEVTLIEHVNDSVKEAEDLAMFCEEIKRRVPGMKLVVNLIPFNDIGHNSYKRSPDENIAKFQKVMVGNGVKTYVRTTRGDDENAACGQLATKKLKAVDLLRIKE